MTRWPLGLLLSSLFLPVSACGDGPSDDQAGRPLEPFGADLIASVADGRVQGDVVGSSVRFLKIPYAKPPVGELRWKAPEPNAPWSGVRHEQAFAAACPQLANSQGPASSEEDCLYLNVWAPNPAPSKAPVMVWIHGGGNFAGSAGDKNPAPAGRR
ncbi:MAG: carboxylesterase family protein [Myxococcales bacterium]